MRFYYDNKFDNVNLTDIQVSSQVSTLPKANLQNTFRTKVWRATDCEDELVQWDYGEDIPVNYIAVINHNLTYSGQMRYTISSTGLYTGDIYNSGWLEAQEAVIGYGEGEYGGHGYGGYLLPNEQNALSAGLIRIINLNGTYAGRYHRIGFKDSTNPDGYIECGRIFNGKYFEPERNFSYNWGYTVQEATQKTYSIGGQVWTDIGAQSFQVGIELNTIKDFERYWHVIDMLRRWGIRKDILLSLYPNGNAAQKFFTTLYGRFDKIPVLNQTFLNKNNIKITFQESR